MQIDLSNTQALVTGATAGIGLSIATELARAGAGVSIVGRDAARVEAAVASINRVSGLDDASGVVADAGTAEGCQAVIQARPQVDILVNNLGIYGACPFFEIDDGAWEEIFQVNVMSGVRLARHYAQGMQARGWGRIQFISSESALNIPAEMVHYGVSKAALQGVSRGLAKVLAGTGVTVEQMEALFLQENRPSTLLKRFATPEEVASLSVYAASPQASATTGAALRVEGGIVESIS